MSEPIIHDIYYLFPLSPSLLTQGGQKFVMVRKILEVKEVTRIATENYLARQMQLASSFDNNKTANE